MQARRMSTMWLKAIIAARDGCDMPGTYAHQQVRMRVWSYDTWKGSR